MKKRFIWVALTALLLLLIYNMASRHVDGVKSEKEWYIQQLGFDFSGVLDSAEKKGQALIRVTHGKLDIYREDHLDAELRYNGMLDLFLYRSDGKIDLMIPEDPGLSQGDSVYVNTDLGTAKFFRDGVLFHEHSLLKSLRGRPF